MNRLKQLREEKGLTQEELSKELRKLGLYIAKQEIKAYEIFQLRMHNDDFWSRVANYFNVTLAYLMGDSKIPNEDYIVDLQEVLHREIELKLEKAKLEKNLEEALAQNDAKDKRFTKLEAENKELQEKIGYSDDTKIEFETMLDLAKRATGATQFLVSEANNSSSANAVSRAIKRYEEFLEKAIFAKNRKIKELQDDLSRLHT